MTIQDPKTYMKKPIDTDDEPDDLRDQIAALQATVASLVHAKAGDAGLTEEKLEKMLGRVAQMSAEAAERAANPSNKTHPAISVYSYPEGDRARARAMKCAMFWAGYDLQIDTTTAEEIELLNLAEPGVYPFKRTDGSRDDLTVTGEKGPDGKYARLLFTFMAKERRESLPSMVSMLQQAFGVKTQEQLEIERLKSELEQLRQPVAR